MRDIMDAVDKADSAVDTEAQARALEAEAKRLASLPVSQRAIEEKTVAKKFGVAVSILRALIKAHLPDDGGDERAGKPLRPHIIEPWPDAVNGTDMLDELAAEFRKYVVMSAESMDAVALWMVHTHIIDACHYTPRLFITSPEKRCGKSRLLRALRNGVRQPQPAGNVSSSAFYRTIQAVHPTLLLDEFDAQKKDDEEMRGVINNGYERDNPVIRCDPNTLEPMAFDTFTPCAIAAIGRTWPTVEDRSITVRLHRKAHAEKVKPLRKDYAPVIAKLGRMAARWAIDNISRVEDMEPEIPDVLDDRAADIWEPLIAIADLAGGNWPERARRSAVALSAEGVMEDQSIGPMFLADLRVYLDDHTGDSFTTREIIDYLVTLEERPWPVYGRSRKPITARQVADILRPYELRSTNVRRGTEVVKGYRRDALLRVLGRYSPSLSATPLQPAENCGKSGISIRYNSENVAAEKGRKPAENLDCSGVAAENPQNGGIAHKVPELPLCCDDCGGPLEPAGRGTTWLKDNGKCFHKGCLAKVLADAAVDRAERAAIQADGE